MLKDKLYLLIQRPMFTLGEIGKPILEHLTNSEQQRNPTFWHVLP